MKINIAFIAAVLMAIIFGITACAAFKLNTDSVCDKVPEGEVSLICVAADSINTTPEAVARVLRLGSATLIHEDKVSAEEILTLISEAKDKLERLDRIISPANIIAYLEDAVSGLSMEAKIMIEVMDPFANVEISIPKVLSPYDIGLILKHLDDQERLVKALM